MTKGLLIAIEGIDGTGKSTLVKNLKGMISKYPSYKDHQDDFVFTKEPYDYDVVKAKLNNETDPIKALDMLVDDYMHHLDEVIYPALESGKVIITDRFIGSRYAYQTAAINKTPGEYDADIDFITSRHPVIVEPDLTILMRVQDSTRAARLGDRNTPEDIENRIDVKIADEIYNIMAERNPSKYYIIWAEGCARCVATNAFRKIESLIKSQSLWD